jgi:hypothetical protein
MNFWVLGDLFQLCLFCLYKRTEMATEAEQELVKLNGRLKKISNGNKEVSSLTFLGSLLDLKFIFKCNFISERSMFEILGLIID